MEQLSQRLNKEDYELVQELQAQTAITQCEENESYFNSRARPPEQRNFVQAVF